MNLTKMMEDFVQYFTEGFARIFGPNDDESPDIGIQPFEGDPYQPKEADL